MARRISGAALNSLQTLFSVGAVGSLTDAQLLDQFLSRHRDAAEAAFGVLVERHGPMVLGVCRCILKDRHETEDAFQATFLVLVRKANSIRRRDSLGPWLHGIAHRVAVRARVKSARLRTLHQPFSEEMDTGQLPDEISADELAVLHGEVERLPAKLRGPVTLCYLEGMTYEAAARSLGVTDGVVRGRLARAREILRSRLTHRGLAPFAVLPAGSAAKVLVVPPTLLGSTTDAALRVSAGRTLAEVVSASVTSLTEGVLRTMLLTKLKVASAAFLAVGVLCPVVAVLATQKPETRPASRSTERFGQESGVGLVGSGLLASFGPDQPGRPEIDASLAKLVPGRVVRTVGVTKDCMVLSYLPDWSHGDVDNIGVANNDGGVRTYLDWPPFPRPEAISPDRQFLLALYARTTKAKGKAGPILAFEVTNEWPERTSWKTQPGYDADPAGSFRFEPGEGWKLFDVTPVVQARARADRKAHGLLLRFLNEDRPGGGDWSGYQFVSREGTAEFVPFRPMLLIVEPTKK